jgi:hypothetical protein
VKENFKILYMMFFGNCPHRPTIEKNHQGSLTIFLQLQIEFFFPPRYDIILLSSNILEVLHVFDALRTYSNSP